MEVVDSPVNSNNPANLPKAALKMSTNVEFTSIDEKDEGYASNDAVTPTYVIPDRVHSDKDNIRVVSVGAGASGLCLAYKMERALTNYELVCYEK
jgi:hypothetical protein